MPLIDTHIHLTSACYEGQVEAVLARSRQAEVQRWITVGTTVEDSRAALALCARYEGVNCTVGVHPHDAARQRRDYLAELEELTAGAGVCALGEMGLDYHYEYSDRKSQRRVFAEQLALAVKRALPAVVHCREAFDDCLAVLDEQQLQGAAVVFHCFSESESAARAVLDRGYYVSFTGTITFTNAHDLRRTATYIPLERIMLETDAPYLSPEPKRKVRPNEPALLVHTAARLAEIKGHKPEKIAEVTWATSRCFYRLDTRQ